MVATEPAPTAGPPDPGPTADPAPTSTPGAPVSELDDEPGLEPRPFSDLRGDVILLDSVTRDHSVWLQLHVGGSLYDARRNAFIGRLSPSILGGYRGSRFGAFLIAEADQVYDFTLDTERLDVFNAGAGLEVMNFLGHVRTSLAFGASVLLTDTAIDESGEVGWFVDFRPGSLRWGIGDRFAFEVTPISLDVICPVTSGIPLFVFTYMTLLGVEWSVL